MHVRTVTADTGTTHIVNRYEGGDTAFTECGESFDVDEIAEREDVDEDDLCGRCTR